MTPDIGLANWFRERALRTPERKALRFEGRDWTYAEMQQAIEDCAARLAALGIARGDRVAFLGFNQPMFFFAMFGAARLGAIFVPLNFRLTGPELAFRSRIARRARSSSTPTIAPVIEPQLPRLTSLKALLRRGRGGLDEGRRAGSRPVRVGDDDVALIMYTSGTTGRPKGAMLTHGNIWWNNANGMHTLDCLADDVTLTAAPIFHIGGLNVTTLRRLPEGRARRAAPDVRSRPGARRHRGAQGHDDVRRAGDVSVHGPASGLRRDGPVVGPPAHRRRRAVPRAGAQDLSRARRLDAAGLRADRDLADGELPRARICAEQARLVRQDADVRRGEDRRFEGRDDRGARASRARSSCAGRT